MDLDKRRWLILAAGILANLCQGAAYASSVFAKPIVEHLGCMVPKMIPGADGMKIPDPTGAMVPDMRVWATVFSINLACLPIGMLLSGKIADKYSSRLVVILGGILFAAGVFLAGYSDSVMWLNITFGAMMGLGSGAAYGAIVATSVRWFPDLRGLASGLAVGALGFGSCIIPPIALKILASAPEGAVPVLYTLKVLGVAFIILIAIASIVVVNPPADYKPKGFSPTSQAAKAATGENLSWTQMLGRGKFWILYIMYACGAFSGLMIISQASPIAQQMTKEIIDLAKIDPKAAAGAAGAIVSLLGLANAIGRVLWGWISDKAGRMQALTAMFFITAVGMFILPKFVTQTSTFNIGAIMIGLCYGGYLGIFPSLCADNFGAKNMAVNYALLFSAFSVAAIAGPMVGAMINKNTGSYDMAFLIAGGVAAFGMLLGVIMIFAGNKKKPVGAS